MRASSARLETNMNRTRLFSFSATLLFLFTTSMPRAAQGQESSHALPLATTQPASVAATPPMGWNSYDAYGTSITEEETLANARGMRSKLLAHGWNTLVIDARWYDSVSSFDD